MIIDGERQGFSDVESVKSWLETASQRASTFNVLSGEGGSVLPPFASADEVQSQLSLDSNKAALRVRRPRVDWFFEPCDLIADVYWVELDNHKHLIEDRNWFKIFPCEGALMSRPMSRQTDDGISPFQTQTHEDTEATPDLKDLKLIRPDTDQSQNSAKERAKQKLQIIGGTLHRHTPSGHAHHDFLRSRRGSGSESDSDNDVKSEGRPRRGRTARAGTISSHTNDLLEKQMLEMIAQEEKQRLSQVLEAEVESLRFETTARAGTPAPPHQAMDRKGSLTDPSDSDHRSLREKAQMEALAGYHIGKSKRGRQLLDDVDSPNPCRPS